MGLEVVDELSPGRLLYNSNAQCVRDTLLEQVNCTMFVFELVQFNLANLASVVSGRACLSVNVILIADAGLTRLIPLRCQRFTDVLTTKLPSFSVATIWMLPPEVPIPIPTG